MENIHKLNNTIPDFNKDYYIEYIMSICKSLCLALSKNDSYVLRKDAIRIIDEINTLFNNDTPLSGSHNFDEKGVDLSPFFQLPFSENTEPTGLPAKLPAVAPIKWAKRATFIVDEIKDEYTRNKLKAHPELEKQIREAQDPLTFFNLVWKDYGELLYQIDLKGQQKTKTNQNFAKKPIDKTLFDRLSDYCRDNDIKINTILPNKRQKIDLELKLLENQGFVKNDLNRLVKAANRRAKTV